METYPNSIDDFYDPVQDSIDLIRAKNQLLKDNLQQL
jgi:pantothenate kinase-related protein Tda10